MGGHMQQPGWRSAQFAVHVAFMGSAPLPHSYHLVAKSRLQHIDVNSSHCLADISSRSRPDRSAVVILYGLAARTVGIEFLSW